MGKLIAKSRSEVELSASILDHYATRSGYGRELSDLGMAEFVNKKLLRTLPADSPLAAVAG